MKNFNKWFETTWEQTEDDYELFPSERPTKEQFKYIFLSDYIFDVITYDDDLSYVFGKKIYEVMKTIQEGQTFDYIKQEEKYIDYILVCNLLESFDLIEWGSSVRGAWFVSDAHIKREVGCWELDGTAVYENPTISIKNLIKWLES